MKELEENYNFLGEEFMFGSRKIVIDLGIGNKLKLIRNKLPKLNRQQEEAVIFSKLYIYLGIQGLT